MDLKGAKIQNFYNLTNKIEGSEISSAHTIRIPHYQRPYKWTPEHIEKLIDDWWRADHENSQDGKYFAGAAVTVAPSGTEEHHLIDGQQRVTTLFLTNYIGFLVTRLAIGEAAKNGNALACQRMLAPLAKFSTYLLSKNDAYSPPFLEKVAKDKVLQELINELDSTRGDENQRNEIIDEIVKTLYLPEVYFNSDSNYDKNHKKLLNSFFTDNTFEDKNQKIRLVYDRNSYNSEIYESLISIVIKYENQDLPLNFKIIKKENSEDYSKNTNQYLVSLEAIFKKFYEITLEKIKTKNRKPLPLSVVEVMFNTINNFLDSISICIVQTGNPNDAYTLFEVLNDRALALDDLDLIKNIFYKHFVLNNQESNLKNKQNSKNKLSAKKIDEYIQKADTQWVDKIFKRTGAKESKLIAYLAIVYITGNINITYRDAAGYRTAVDELLKNKNDFNEVKIKEYFNIFESARVFIDVFDIKFQSQLRNAIAAEINNEFSTFHKTVQLLSALGQEGVLSGLFNYAMSSIKQNIKDIKYFDPNLIKQQFEKIRDEKFSDDLYKQAHNVWKTSIMAKDAAMPRALSTKLIINNNLQSQNGPTSIPADETLLEPAFKSWLSDWRYGNKDEKIRILFARLLKLELSNNKDKLIKYSFSTTFDNFQLDHLEPVSIDKSKENLYFKDSIERADLINGLGNMMPLSSRQNNDKNNSPISESRDFFEDAGLKNHHLIKEAYEIYENNKDKNTAPTADFFHKRKDSLIKLFNLVVKFQYEK